MAEVTSTIVTTRTLVLDETAEGNGTLTIVYSGDTVEITLDDGSPLTLSFTAEGFAKLEQKIRNP